MPVPPLELLLAFAITAAATALQGTVGFGMATASVPLLALMDPLLAPVPQLLLAIPLTAYMAINERAHLDLKGVAWVLLGRLPGAAIGLFLLKLVDPQGLSLAIGVIVLGAVIVLGTGLSIPRNRGTSFLAGTAAGVSGLVASIGGPPVALLYRESAGATLRSSLATIFVFGITLNTLVRGFGGEILMDEVVVALWLMPSLAVGLWMSRFTAGRLEGAGLRLAVLIVSGLAGLALILRAVI